jgi:hypothetical protein
MRRVLFVLAGLAVAVGSVAGWVAWEARRTWSRLDSAAAGLTIPDGMSELLRVRQGQGFCWVSCTGGGEAVLTVVLDASELTIETACDELRPLVQELSEGPAHFASIPDYQCGYVGSLYDDASVIGTVARRVDLCEPPSACGTRWMETQPVPDVPLLAWIEFNSGIE